MLDLAWRSISHGRPAGMVPLAGAAVGCLCYLGAAVAGLCTLFVAVPAAPSRTTT